MDEKERQEALFWSTLLYPIIFGQIEKGEIRSYVESLSKKEIVFPNGEKKKPGLSTLWSKLRTYREDGFESLARKHRSDRGKIRSVEPEIIEKAIALKKDQPLRSHQTINTYLQEHYGVSISKSTLYRHLRQAGATKLKLGVSKKKVRCRWSREHTNSLWLGDFEHGPRVLIDGKSYKTYLSAFIDCHSRYIVEARYYLRENLAVLEDTLIRAWTIHGAPNQLHLDNAKVYHAKALQSSCLALGIELLHRPPREPESGGKIEKFFQTVQNQFESEIRADTIMDLSELNRKFLAWLHQGYHKAINSETKQTPKERYDSGLTVIRKVDITAALKYFYKHEQRTVHKDFSDIALNSQFYKVNQKLRGDRVKVSFDPFSKPLETVFIYSLKGEYLGKGKLHEREKQPQPILPNTTSNQLKYDVLATYIDKHDRELNVEIQGIDYLKALSSSHWPFLSFLQALARFLGRKGGNSAFSSDELQALEKIYQSNPNLNESLLEEAFENAEEKNILCITFHLQNLVHRKAL